DHHLVPGLIAPVDLFRRIRVEFIVRGIVVVRDDLEAASFGRRYRVLEEVSQLPPEVEAGHAKQDARFAIRINQRVEKIFPSQMHVRVQTFDVTVLLEGKAGGRFIIRVAWRDDKRMSSGPGGNYSLLNRRFGEDESDGRPVAPYYSVGRVMHLEDEHG